MTKAMTISQRANGWRANKDRAQAKERRAVAIMLVVFRLCILWSGGGELPR